MRRCVVGDRGERAWCRVVPSVDEARRHRLDLVAVAHPHVEVVAVREAAEDAVGARRRARGAGPYSRLGAALDLAAEQLRDELHAVADAEDRHAEVEDARVDPWARRRRRRSTGRPRG